MKYKYLITIILGMCLTEIASAKPPFSGDIVGRDLNYPGLGWLGHVGLVTGDNVGSYSNVVIETLNSSPVIQLNSLEIFQLKSKYWGSRYGIGIRGSKSSTVVVSAEYFLNGICDHDTDLRSVYLYKSTYYMLKKNWIRY